MITIEEQIKCVAREIALRRTCYPRWVKDNKMKPDAADHELAAMEAVMATLKCLKDYSEHHTTSTGRESN